MADFVVKVAGEPDPDRMSSIFVLLLVSTRHLRRMTDGSELKKDVRNDAGLTQRTGLAFLAEAVRPALRACEGSVQSPPV